MARLVWNQGIEKPYETGIDRGVLYPGHYGNLGVPWNGLISVDEAFVGGDHEEYHYDGIKYVDLVSSQNFQATLKAFSAPAEFSMCLGEVPVRPGFFLTRQPRQPFGLTYRTLVGENDYKLHVVYNASVSPSPKRFETLSGDPNPAIFEWVVDAVPELEVPTSRPHKPTAHFVIDSNDTDPAVLKHFEDRIYGSMWYTPRLMSPADLVDHFNV